MPHWFESGGPVMWPLLACSMIVITLLLERGWFWLRERLRLCPERVERCLAHAERAEVESALRSVEGQRDPALRVLEAGLRELPLFPTSSMEGAAKQELERMNRGLHMLDTMITVAPMLGILGTVMGVIQSFELLGATAQNPREVVGGIAEALITTASGLSIAIAALLPYNLFSALRRKQALRLEDAGRRCESACLRAGLTLQPAAQEEDPAREVADALASGKVEVLSEGRVAGRAAK